MRISIAQTKESSVSFYRNFLPNAFIDSRRNDMGQKLQAMDNSHVALVSLSLDAAGFEDGYRCDRNMYASSHSPFHPLSLHTSSYDFLCILRYVRDSDDSCLTILKLQVAGNELAIAAEDHQVRWKRRRRHSTSRRECRRTRTHV